MALTPFSGKSGKVLISAASVASVTQWSFSKEAETDRFASSESSGYKLTYSGSGSATGSIEFKVDRTGAFPALEGTSATLLLYVNGSVFYSVPAIMKNFKITTDIDTGKVVAGTCDFESNGAWAEPTWA
jgi:hypothetical protein